MHRGGGEDELLAISPPPEFQDLPAPPPTVFRDLSPAARAARGNTRSVLKPPYKNRPCSTSPEVWDFASRISFDILNEAMVIATEEVLASNQHGGCNADCSRTAPNANQQFDSAFSSDSSDDEVSHPLSTTTSWEYLSKASSWSDLRNISQRKCSPSKPFRVRTSPRHAPSNLADRPIRNPNCINSSTTTTTTSSSNSHQQHITYDNQNPVSFHNEECPSRPNGQHSVPPPPLMTRSASFQLEVNLDNHNQNRQGQSTSNSNNENASVHRRSNCRSRTRDRNSIDLSSLRGGGGKGKTMGETEECYNLPYQCDIYSFPIDSIAPHEIVANRRPIAAPRRSRLGNSQVMNANAIGRNSGDKSLKSDSNVNVSDKEIQGHSRSPLPGPSTSSTISKCNRESTKKTPLSAVVSIDTTRMKSLKSERYPQSQSQSDSRNNSESCNTAGEEDNDTRKLTARRSRSVEMKISDIGNDSSRMRILSKENRPACGTGVVKCEKRTLGHSILNLFKRKPRSKTYNLSASVTSFHNSAMESSDSDHKESCNTPTISRALPPTPTPTPAEPEAEPEPTVQISTSFPHNMELNWPDDDNEDPVPTSPVEVKDFAASIEKVKDCGWYWGPLSSEAAEDLLRGEPDGSFIVRDSSDAHYIFSLTFKLNGLVRHVRIEHDQGNFSFGPLTRFKASTIVDFVEKAVAHSRSGRYLFFLHRRPVLGPMRVQLLHPYSRYKHHRSLQHMCRFVILKYVRRDLINTLPLPKPLQDYLNTPHYYFEKQEAKKICS